MQDIFLLEKFWTHRVMKAGKIYLDTDKYFRNLVTPSQIWIVNTIFSIDLAPNGIQFVAKSNEKWWLQSKVGLV